MTNLFNYRFAQGVSPGQVTKRVIKLLKQKWFVALDDYKLIIILNTEFMISAQVPANHLRIFVENLIGICQNYDEKIIPKQITLWFAQF